MRISVWLYLLQQMFASAVLTLSCTRMLHLRCPPGGLAIVSLLGGGASLTAAIVGSPWLQAAMLLPACLLPRLTLHTLPRRAFMHNIRLALMASMVGASLCSLAFQLGAPPLWTPLALGGTLLLKAPAAAPCSCAEIVIRHGAVKVSLTALTDSGNLLRDPLTSLPVIVCARRAVTPLFPAARTEPCPPGMRLISVCTVAGTALLPLFRPDSLRIRTDGQWTDCQALIGLAPNDYSGCQAIVPASLMNPQGGL